jgi:hypothetical protein
MPEGCRGRVGVTLILISCDEAECWAYMKLNEIRGLGMSMTTGAAVLRQMRIAMLALAFYSRRLSFRYAHCLRPSLCLQWGNDERRKGCRRVRTWHHQCCSRKPNSSAASLFHLSPSALPTRYLGIADMFRSSSKTPDCVLGGRPAF